MKLDLEFYFICSNNFLFLKFIFGVWNTTRREKFVSDQMYKKARKIYITLKFNDQS